MNSSRETAEQVLGSRFRSAARSVDGTLVVTASGDFDLDSSQTFEEALAPFESALSQECVLDLREVEFIDSSGMREVVALNRRLKRQGSALTIVCRPGQVKRAFEIAGLAETLPIVVRDA